VRRLIALAVCGLVLLTPLESAAAGGGVVLGTVTPVEWAPEVEVCVVESQASETCTAPEANGSYVLDGVPFGGAQIEFVPSFRSRLLTEYYDGVGNRSEARTILLSAQDPEAEHIDASLLEGGSIKGVVTAAEGGEPLPDVEVCAVSTGTPTVKSCGETDPAGAYDLHSLPTGPYGVAFRGVGKSAIYVPWSRPVTVTAGATTAGVDASLAEGARIEGVVMAATGGARLAGISVCLFVTTAPEPRRCSFSDEVGAYSFEGLPNGSYQVGFSLTPAEIGAERLQGEDDGFESQYYDGVGSRAAATTISVLAPEAIEGVDAALLTPVAPPLSAPTAVVAAPATPAPPTILEPKPKKKGCPKGYRHKKVKGKVRCVKPGKRKTKKHHHAKPKASHR
jgi:hypothetical protein